jgi:tryptophan synthase beta chain
VRPLVKICGLTRPEDAALATRLGATHLGCVLVEDTPRCVDAARARAVFAAGSTARGVLVFRSPDPIQVLRAVDVAGTTHVQIDASAAATVETLEAAGLTVYRSYVVSSDDTSLPAAVPPASRERPIVLDTGGGTGRRFDWSLLTRGTETAPEATFVAGGVGPDNIGELLTRRPWGIDVSSGVESAPGQKDAERLERLFAALAHLPSPEPVRPRVGRFGAYGGRYVHELLVPALEELEEARRRIVPSREFRRAFAAELRDWAGRPTPLTPVPALSRRAGLTIVLKREDLLHGGAHKTNNTVGQALLARFMGKRRLIAETGAGQHGTATAMIGARLGLETVIYMGEKDVERQAANVDRMRLCGARVVPVATGARTLKDAIDEALRDWTANVADTHYLLGTVCGPHPFPRLVRDFQAVIGRESKAQWRRALGGVPDAVVACVGGGSNAIGIFSSFLSDLSVRLIGVEPAGRGLASGLHGAALCRGSAGLLHGARTSVLQDEEGQVAEPHSVAAGLDYPGVGPEHAALRDSGRVRYVTVDDDSALAAFGELSRTEGIVPALESAHAVAFALRAVERGLLPEGARVLVNLSGRGDKDLAVYARERSWTSKVTA